MKIGITGANGHLGTRLIGELIGSSDLCAVVRSETARNKLLFRYPELEVCVASYSDSGQLAGALANCEVIVHLVGIIKETRNSSFKAAHEDSCTALIAAAETANIRQIIYLSIVGTNIDSKNNCLSSKARAEVLLTNSDVITVVIKIPMVLGEGDFASRALKNNAIRKFPVTFRADSLEQPIYAGDVVAALKNAIDRTRATSTICLAGIESVTRRELIHRGAKILGTSPNVVSLPMTMGMAFAWLLERLSNPPISRDMLGVLDHDDRIDVRPGCAELKLSLTSLDDTLRSVLKPD